jgi:hypothetical protein
MTDIVERRKLSENHRCWDCDYADELIAEVERLQALLREGLAPARLSDWRKRTAAALMRQERTR